MDNFQEEGLALIDILRSKILRITLLVLLPYQTVPQHLDPAYDQESGKEETLRVLYGHTKVYTEGSENNHEIQIPHNKKQYYTACHEIALIQGEQYTIPPQTLHWFQAGALGSVNLEFQNRVDETKNIFTDASIILK